MSATFPVESARDENGMNEVAIAGGGIVGLSLALNFHARGIPCQVFEAAPVLTERGVGITLLPHAVRELTMLGLQEQLLKIGVANKESAFFNRFGQLIYKEPRGLSAGLSFPEIGIHRGRWHALLLQAVHDRIGADAVVTNCQCVGVQQDADSVTLLSRATGSGEEREPVLAKIVVACDGINSAIRKQFYPDESVVFTGINTWRGVTYRPPILDGATYMRIGSIRTGKLVVYPIIDNVDGHGRQLINWVAEIERPGKTANDWNAGGRLEDFGQIYADWQFDWLDATAMLRDAADILEYPMVDKEPIDRWSFGRVTFAGDAAHPMYPRGSNGAAQGLIDARTLADLLKSSSDWPEALSAYETARCGPTASVVRANRAAPPDIINITVENLFGDRPFENLDAKITQEELRLLSERYKSIAGFDRTQL
jgi:5-methylphenazine-1-carboxylate 1-monooxygenase